MALEARFLASQAETGTGSSAPATLVYAAGQSDGKERGRTTSVVPGWCSVVGGHWGLVPKLQALAVAGNIEPTTCRRA